MMRSYVRLFLICVTVVLVAVLATEKPQTAITKNSGSDSANELCVGVVPKPWHDGTRMVLNKIVFNGEPEIAASLPWRPFSRPEVTRLLGASLQRIDGSPSLILGLPEENAPAPPRSILAPAQIVDVTVNSNFFSPAVVSITAGDTVRWTWNGSLHSVTGGTCCEANGDFCSPSNFNCSTAAPSGVGDVYTHTFNTPNTYDYFCSVHLGAMTGRVIVNPAPTQSATVQFSASTATATETPNATTKVDVTVTRSGDTSGTSTIDYASADGSASERSDYEAALGTLRFAAGEATKTITVFIVDDRFGESAETFNVNLSNPVGCTLGSPATFTVTINSDESVNGLNPVKDASFNTDFFVRQHYLDFFNRVPDQGGLDFWKNQIDECETRPPAEKQACREIRRINVSAAFFLSIEFQQTGYLVERLYMAAYGSAQGTSTLGGTHQLSVPIVRLNEFLPDTQQIGRGVIIGQPGADQLLENNKQTLIAEFVLRSRFTTAYPIGMPAAQFVDTLNANAGGALSPAERDQLVTDLTSGAKTRAQVLRAVAEDPDLFAAETNRAFVLAQFFGYLRRNPNDSPDSDYTGYDFWLGKLNQFNGNFVNAEMVKAFIVSGEYQGRFGP